MQNRIAVWAALAFVVLTLFPCAVRGQAEPRQERRRQRPLAPRQRRQGKPIPLESYEESDFLKTFELKEKGDLNVRVFMGNSLTNYLHRLAPELSADELVRKGNYQFSFFVDGALVYRENLHVGAGLPESKHTRTVFRVPLMTTTDEDSWGKFMWNRFLLNGGEEARTAGTHLLKIEIRPYLKTTELKVGGLIAEGQLQLVVVRPEVDEARVAVQPVKPGSGWETSREVYDEDKIRELNRRIAQNLYKEITSIVVIKNGRLSIEEYFNGATRDTLHDTRSVGKSFASALAGIAVGDGHLKGEHQTLKEFYDLGQFANRSRTKDGVTLKGLLTMSSGFDADDNDEESPGNEEKMYPTGDWVKFARDLPMAEAQGGERRWRYFTAGVVVLGDILHRSVPGGLETYADKKLFKPLGVRRYDQLDGGLGNLLSGDAGPVRRDRCAHPASSRAPRYCRGNRLWTTILLRFIYRLPGIIPLKSIKSTRRRGYRATV